MAGKLQRILCLLLLLAVGTGLLVAVVHWRDEAASVLGLSDYVRDDAIVASVLKAIAMILIGAPLAALLWTVIGLGDNASRKDQSGMKILRLKAGARYGLTLCSLCLAAVAVAGALESERLAATIFISIFAVFSVLAATWIWFARVRFNTTELFVLTWYGREQRFEWAHLSNIETDQGSREYKLLFEDGRKATISFFFAGVGEVMRIANTRLAGHSDYSQHR